MPRYRSSSTRTPPTPVLPPPDFPTVPLGPTGNLTSAGGVMPTTSGIVAQAVGEAALPSTIGPPPSSSPARYWDQGPGFLSLRYQAIQALWWAGAAKMSYCSDPDKLAAYCTAIGARAAAVVVPAAGVTGQNNGIVITYPNDRIYVIQGTTNFDQVKRYMWGTTLPYLFGFSGTPFPLDESALAGLCANVYMGYYYTPFVDLAAAWYRQIKADVFANPSVTRVWLGGHSLGAACCEVITNVLSKLMDRSIDPQNTVNVIGGGVAVTPTYGLADVQLARAFQGGFVFAQPLVTQYGTYAYTQTFDDSTNLVTLTRQDYVSNAQPFSAKTALLKRVNDPRDPVGALPVPFRNSLPAYLAIQGLATNRQLTHHTTPYHLNDEWTLQYMQRSAFQWPATLTGFAARALSFHVMTSYLAQAWSAVNASYGTPPKGWQDWYQIVLEAPDSEYINFNPTVD